jgi:hypothetical protein
MEPLLTLVIAVGGIATGIGAIWTAVVTRHLARLTEESLREQNERARINLEVDVMQRLDERVLSQRYQNYLLRSFAYVKENYFVDDDILEVDYLDLASSQILNFYEELGYLTTTGVLQLERVWNSYGDDLTTSWVLWEPAVKKRREELKDPTIFEHMEYLYHQLLDLDRQRGLGSERPTKEELRRYVEDSLLAAEVGEEPAAGGEAPTKG